MTASPPALELNSVHFAYDDRPILRDVSLGVARGEFLALIGPNGGGKSTLLKLALGLLAPARGTVRLFGDTPERTRGRVGYVPQETNVNPHFPVTVRDTVRMGLIGTAGARTRAEEMRAVDAALDDIGLLDCAAARIGELSGGQRQRALIARALAGGPELLILDEPVASVDPDGARRLYELLDRFKRRYTVVMVSHDVNLLLRHADSVACVNGELCRHHAPRITPQMLSMAFHCAVDLLETVAGAPPEHACPQGSACAHHHPPPAGTPGAADGGKP